MYIYIYIHICVDIWFAGDVRNLRGIQLRAENPEPLGLLENRGVLEGAAGPAALKFVDQKFPKKKIRKKSEIR